MDLSKFKDAFEKMDYDSKKSPKVKVNDLFAIIEKSLKISLLGFICRA